MREFQKSNLKLAPLVALEQGYAALKQSAHDIITQIRLKTYLEAVNEAVWVRAA